MEDNLGESAHQDCIDKLVEEFGADREPEIREVYSLHRRNLEAGAKILLYTAILTYNSAKKTLQIR